MMWCHRSDRAKPRSSYFDKPGQEENGEVEGARVGGEVWGALDPAALRGGSDVEPAEGGRGQGDMAPPQLPTKDGKKR